MRTITAILLVLAPLIPLRAQNALDSIMHALNHHPKPEVRLDIRNSFITTSDARIFGIKAGMDFNNKVKLGLGFYTLMSDLYKPQVVYNEHSNDLDTVQSKLKFSYLAFYAEYLFYRKNNWEFNFPMHVGIGGSRYKYKPEKDSKQIFDKGAVFLIEPAVEINYRVIRYFGLGIGTGYRIMLKNNPSIEEQFSAPVYVLRLKLYLGDLYKDIGRRE